MFRWRNRLSLVYVWGLTGRIRFRIFFSVSLFFILSFFSGHWFDFYQGDALMRFLHYKRVLGFSLVSFCGVCLLGFFQANLNHVLPLKSNYFHQNMAHSLLLFIHEQPPHAIFQKLLGLLDHLAWLHWLKWILEVRHTPAQHFFFFLHLLFTLIWHEEEEEKHAPNIFFGQNIQCDTINNTLSAIKFVKKKNPYNPEKKKLYVKFMCKAANWLLQIKIFYTAVVWMSKRFLNLGSVGKGQALGVYWKSTISRRVRYKCTAQFWVWLAGSPLCERVANMLRPSPATHVFSSSIGPPLAFSPFSSL